MTTKTIMKPLKNLTTILLTLILLSCTSDDDNSITSVDLSDFEDYSMLFTVIISGEKDDDNPNVQFEYNITTIRTNEDNEIVETTNNETGAFPNDGEELRMVSLASFKEYKLVGIRIDALTENIESLQVDLFRSSDQNTVVNTPVIEFNNSVTVTYDFDAETETITTE